MRHQSYLLFMSYRFSAATSVLACVVPDTNESLFLSIVRRSAVGCFVPSIKVDTSEKAEKCAVRAPCLTFRRKGNLYSMFVVKRDGRREDVKFDKITSRINKLCYGLDNRFVDSAKISQKVIKVSYSAYLLNPDENDRSMTSPNSAVRNEGLASSYVCKSCLQQLRAGVSL